MVSNPRDTNFSQLLGISNTGTIADYFGDGAVSEQWLYADSAEHLFCGELSRPRTAQVVGIKNRGATQSGSRSIVPAVKHGFIGQPSIDVQGEHHFV